ncbi:MAG: hypothetical protein Ta2F_10380 [Termitinemataceae bacterium]|nr:MAG: hypothetical protein Ta2F_10380 [Termitinemataceae bacterium]
MKPNKSNWYFLGALVFAVVTCVFVYIDRQNNKKETLIASDPVMQKVVEIKEKMFLAQVNDVYLNSEDYLGKTIKLEGLFKLEKYGENEDPYCFVLRYGPGCCGSDGNAGFEVAWDKQNAADRTMPKEDDWVEAVGILRSEENDDASFLYLALLELNVLEKRGQEYVAQ